MPEKSSLLELMPEKAMAVSVLAADWREAIHAAGDALVHGGITEPAYTEEMVETIEKLGPYIVIAPGLALAHSRPSPAVKRTGLSWVGLANPVEFGSKRNDPVHLVVGLAALDHDEHLQAMSQLAMLVSDKERLTQLASLDSVEAVREAIQTFERNSK
ncbi:PTS sugar transporter subunit IIA [Actinomycetaceae bacterium L2_0104]